MTRRRSTGVFATMLRGATMLVALVALGVAANAWIDLSRPFDPSRMSPLTVPAAITQQTPAYPGAVTVLTYHDVADGSASSKTLDRRTFAEHMATLSALGYRTVSLATVRDLVLHKPVQLPERPLLLTFDDGSLTTWTTVDPVLERFHFTAVAFLTTDLLVEPGTPSYFLSTRQVRRLGQTGRWEFGSHTADLDKMVPVPGDIQPALTNRIVTENGDETGAQWHARIQDDLARSQRRLKEITGSPAIALSYPFGDAGKSSNVTDIGTELPGLLADAGFDLAFAGENVPTGHIDAVTGSSPRWLLPRIGVRRSTSAVGLVTMIRESMPTPMPDSLTTLRWTGEDSDCLVKSDAIVVGSKAEPYGTCSPRDVNTSRWIDYSLATTVKGLSPRSTAVIGVRDGAGAGHYGRVEVLLGVTRLAIRQRVDSDPIAELRTVPLPGATTRAVRIEVRASTVAVYLGGRRVASVAFDQRLHEGGVTLARIGSGYVTYQDPAFTHRSAP